MHCDFYFYFCTLQQVAFLSSGVLYPKESIRQLLSGYLPSEEYSPL